MNTASKIAARRARLALLAGLLCAPLAAGALAEGQRPCAQDIARLCKAEPRGQARARCLIQHESELSPACKARIDAAKARGREIARACKADVRKQCQGVARGGGRIAQCLRAHEAELSPECRTRLDEARSRAGGGSPATP